jgi:hypothetical protein
MATAALSNISTTDNIGGREMELPSCEVRVWGMDGEQKPFIQRATARYFTEKGALLTGVLPVKMNDVIGLRYLERKARFKITWVSDQDAAQTRSVGVECLEDLNLFGVRRPIPIEATSKIYAASQAQANGQGAPNRREAQRYTCHVAADIRAAGALTPAHASVTDISSKGCYLQMISPLAVGTEISLSVYAKEQGRPLVLRGAVRTSHPMVGMGVQFAKLMPSDLKGIDVVLQRLNGAATAQVEEYPAAELIEEMEPENESLAPASSLEPAAKVATRTAPFELKPAVAGASNTRDLAMRISADLQQLESETALSLHDTALTEHIRQAALHVRNVLRHAAI